jgi:predicted nuclease of predicted toxin-antitoxin system
MRVLLDECLPRRLKQELTGHDARTVPEMGWAGLKNGELLRVAAGQFEAFVTVDRNLPAQQRIEQLPFGVVVIGAPRNDIETLRPLMASVRAALEQIAPGQLVRIKS